LGDTEIVGQPLRTVDRLVDVRNNAAAPAVDLVAKDPEPPGPPGPDRAFCDDAALGAVAVPDRSHLDHEPPLRHAHLEARVVEVG
jgi:hypothetical protein